MLVQIIYQITVKITEMKRDREREKMNKLWRESKSYEEYLDKLGISH